MKFIFGFLLIIGVLVIVPAVDLAFAAVMNLVSILIVEQSFGIIL